MNIPSHLKLLSVFLIGVASATIVILPIALVHQGSRDVPPQSLSGRQDGLPKSADLDSPSAANTDRAVTAKADKFTPSQRSDRGQVPNGGTTASVNASSPANIAPSALNRSAFTTSSAAIDPPAISNRSLTTIQPAGTAPGGSPSTAMAPTTSSGAESSAPAAPPYGASYGPGPATGGSYGSAVPMPNNSGTATQPGSTIEIDQAAIVPASLAQPNPAAKLTPQEQSLAQGLGKQFLDAVGNASPTDPASSDTWNKAQQQNDALYKLYFGYQAYNAQSASAYRDSIQTSGTSP